MSVPTWTTMSSSLNKARESLGATTGPCLHTNGLTSARQCLYAIGGFGNAKSVEYEDPSAATPNWTLMHTSLNITRPAVGATTGPCPGSTGLTSAPQCIYAVGGDSGGATNTVEYLDPSATTPAWTMMTEQMNTARNYPGVPTAPCPGTSGLATARQCLYAMGGSSGNMYLRSVEYEDPGALPTIAPLIHVHVSRFGHGLTVSWRLGLADRSGVLGFTVYAGHHALTHRLIPVHASPRYVVTVRPHGQGHISVHIVLTGGKQFIIPAA
jgi:hypothetical protein